ncbi:hypothetical protein NU08_1299 [Flavobacterium anhuiense]|uniref:Uncharacterized protein n=1 Tax=Flavobacterium anhuiense TaxID=459526 RepID=A0A444W153_9FLAO|nr:hypothetical protein NU08_1299 [Flavobacterium anhuiense]
MSKLFTFAEIEKLISPLNISFSDLEVLANIRNKPLKQ